MNWIILSTLFQNTLVGEEQKEFLTWFKKSSLLLLAEFVDKNSRTGSKFIVGCTHISAAQEESPAMQTLQVRMQIFLSDCGIPVPLS